MGSIGNAINFFAHPSTTTSTQFTLVKKLTVSKSWGNFEHPPFQAERQHSCMLISVLIAIFATLRTILGCVSDMKDKYAFLVTV